jgi:hypothetical protein
MIICRETLKKLKDIKKVASRDHTFIPLPASLFPVWLNRSLPVLRQLRRPSSVLQQSRTHEKSATTRSPGLLALMILSISAGFSPGVYLGELTVMGQVGISHSYCHRRNAAERFVLFKRSRYFRFNECHVYQLVVLRCLVQVGVSQWLYE